MSEAQTNQSSPKSSDQGGSNSDQAIERKNNIAMGSAIVVIALFGLYRQLGYVSVFNWADAIIAAIGVGSAVGGILRDSVLAAIGSLGLAAGAIAYRHDLIEVNIKVLFFIALFAAGAGMVLRGMRKSD